MNNHHFDDLIRSLTTSRRSLLGGSLALAAGWLSVAEADARNKRNHKHKTKKPKPNAFGCLDVGKACGGNNDTCCSGICQGKKPKNGEKDKTTCAAHNVGGCTLDRSLCFNPVAAACSATGICLTTTGNAAFCGEGSGFDPEANCQPCGKDKDCEALGFGSGSACVVLHTQGACVNGCEGINGSTGTACIAPGV